MGISELLSYSERELKEYISKQSDTTKKAVLLFSARLINLIDVKTIQRVAETNAEIRETLHASYQGIEDALEPNCINRVGDLQESKKIQASVLMNAAKAAKKKGQKFDPSPYLPNYECYKREKHGDPVEYLRKHFGEFLGSCNKEGINYLWRGDVPVVDPALWGALYRSHRKEFEKLTYLAGKKSKVIKQQMTSRGAKKLKKISALESSSRK
ncbi:hypothetical protein A9Q91_05080 [Candidatus Gracilibacteria bacterium 28_42_T64]|nr:hypothetical protein A9Q91_05080 [Candidatus Gracilibacteria bacterium 28_42_T64]